MFNIKQQTTIQTAVAAIIVFMISIAAGMTFGAAVVWTLLCGGVFLQLRRQNLFVAEGTDVLDGALEEVRSTVGVARMSGEREVTSGDSGAETAASATDTAPVPARPTSLDGPRDGAADDLTRIDGIGPKLSEALNGIGIYHFDQIARWSAEEVAWVDQNLAGANGRAARDDWMSQARALTN